MFGGSWTVVLIPCPQKSWTTENPSASTWVWIVFPTPPEIPPMNCWSVNLVTTLSLNAILKSIWPWMDNGTKIGTDYKDK